MAYNQKDDVYIIDAKGKKAIKEQLKDAILCAGADHVTFKRDGTIEAKFSYFYRMGNTPKSVCYKLTRAVPGLKVVDAWDDFARWPKTSYFHILVFYGEQEKYNEIIAKRCGN